MRRAVRPLVLLAAIAPVANATTYYVKTNGNDSSSGLTNATAFRTIGKAVAMAQPGDTVYVARGTYNAGIVTTRSGTASAPIRFVADTTGAIFGNRRGTIRVRNASGVAWTVQHNYIALEGFQFYRSTTGALVQNCSGVTLTRVDAVQNSADGVKVTSATVTIEDSSLRSNTSDGLEVGTSGVATARRCNIYSNTANGVLLTAASSSATIRESSIYQNRSRGLDAAAGSLTLVNALVRRNTSDGLRTGNTGSTSAQVWQCTFARNGADGVEVNAGSTDVTNCIIANNASVGIRYNAGSIAHEHNCLFSNSGGNTSGTSVRASEITTNPLFRSTSDFTLRPGSPALDVGSNTSNITTTDLAGNARPQGLGTDLGCYEGGAASLFTDVSASTGFAVTNAGSSSEIAGIHWADLDNDGDLDCILTGASARVLINHNAGQSFSSVYLGVLRGQGVLLDANNDGYVDFWNGQVGDANTERLFLNVAGTLDAGSDAGFPEPAGNRAAAAIDLDRDGWSDVLALTTTGNFVGVNARSATPALSSSLPASLNASGLVGSGRAVATADANEDGVLDLFYPLSSGKLLLSTSTPGVYGLFAPPSGGTGGFISSFTSTAPFGAAWGDFDRDGDADLFVSNPDASGQSHLYDNDPVDPYVDVSLDVGIDPSNGHRGCAWGDFNNDGLLDLYVAQATGGNQLFRQHQGDLVLTGLGSEIDCSALDVCFVDYDNDGDLDLSITRGDGAAILLRNETNNTNYLKVRVVGAGTRGTDVCGVGTRLELFDAAGTYLGRRDVGVARGLGTEPLWAHFAVPNPAATYTLKAYFASGERTISVVPSTATTTIGSRTIARMVTITEPMQGPPLVVTRWREVAPDE